MFDMRKLKLINTLTIAVGGVFLSAVSAFSDPILGSTSYGGDTYVLYANSGISWSQAEANAVADGGYLAALNTSDQTMDIEDNLIAPSSLGGGGGGNEIWLGASPLVGTSTTDPNNWAWVNGSAWTSFDAGNFSSGEPNGDASSHLAINLETPLGTFNDEGDAGEIGGYIVETVPDGGVTAAMLGLAMGGLGWMRRKF
jgi:hypothetical protein